MYLFRPHVARLTDAYEALGWLAQTLEPIPPREVETVRSRALKRVTDLPLSESQALHLRIAFSVLCDLRAHDWGVKVIDGGVRISHPDRTEMDPRDHKRHIRDSLLVERNAQLTEPATRRFVTGMERPRRHGSGFRSVFSLLRDGAELAEALKDVRQIPRGPERTYALRCVIDPYAQVVESGVTCEHTGLNLQDIWRYFRHTWVTPYRSVPGRQISFLIRDRAVENHPVVGIGSLASSVVQQKERDRWIGWHPSVFIESLEADRYKGWSRWLCDRLEELISEIYVRDFFDQGIIAEADLSDPPAVVIGRLSAVAKEAREAHRLYRQEDRHKKFGVANEVDWQVRAKTHLFRAKRAERLADLLRARRDLVQAGFTKISPERLRRAVGTSAGRRAIFTVLRFVKASRVGIDMMDISVCGAVDPYRSILGGKLVSLLLASPDVVEAYSDRYRASASIIASSMAGRAVNRTPRLVLLMTTSLYSVASSQYNRLKVRPERHGGEGILEYRDLAHTAGFGSYHFSKATMDAMEILLAQAEGGREVNSIFGEGVNPKLRKVRAALEKLGLPSDTLLQHGSRRIVYGVSLASNFRDILVRRARRPKYVLPTSRQGTRELIEFWYDRWLSMRIERDEILDRVASHGTDYPINHGARVRLPKPEGTKSSCSSTARSK